LITYYHFCLSMVSGSRSASLWVEFLVRFELPAGVLCPTTVQTRF
jgi:hypothetical protein